MDGGDKRRLLRARTEWQAGRRDQAEATLRSLLSALPADADALVALAELLSASERHHEAIPLLKKLVASHPGVAAHARRLGAMLLAGGDLDGAQRHLEDAVRLEPKNARGHNNLGEVHMARSDRLRAIECYRRAIECDGSYALAYSNLGRALVRSDLFVEAIEHLERAVALAPTLVAAHVNRGVAFAAQSRFTEALASFEKACLLDPKLSAAWIGKANVEVALGASRAALLSTDRALALVLDPNDSAAIVVRSQALRALGQSAEARRCLERSLARNPDDVNVLSELGAFLGSESDYGAATPIFERLATLAPQHPYVHGYRLFLKLLCANWTGYEGDIVSLRAAVERGEEACTPLQSHLFFDSSATVRRCAETFVQHQYPGWSPRATEGRVRTPGSRIRIAYLSGDFGDHPVSHLLAGVLECHDKSLFDVWALGWGTQQRGAIRTRIERSVSNFVDISDHDDAHVARMLKDAEVDIAVDLVGHTRGQRLGIFALGAAPIQVNYLGFPGSMAAPFMDYMIADAVVIPEEEQCAYSERIVRLPHSYLPAGDRPEALAPVSRTEMGLPENAFVFCAFNNPFKITPPWFDLWMRLLTDVPAGVLWLRNDDPVITRNLREAAAQRGVAPERLIMAGRLESRSAHLARYSIADLFLDTLPYNAHATACDALRMGLPVLTCLGSTFCGRVGASLLATLGLGDLVAADVSAYERQARALALEGGRLGAIRSLLARRMVESPLFDTHLYCRHLEAAYRIMWQRELDGAGPSSFAVPPLPGSSSQAVDLEH
jgi:predicted O-linked N-acetylglucosamine transferase (SPINDLY family)